MPVLALCVHCQEGHQEPFPRLVSAHRPVMVDPLLDPLRPPDFHEDTDDPPKRTNMGICPQLPRAARPTLKLTWTALTARRQDANNSQVGLSLIRAITWVQQGRGPVGGEEISAVYS